MLLSDFRWFDDARTYQILFLLLFLVLGMGTRDWSLQPGMIGVSIATCLSTQWILTYARQFLQDRALEKSGDFSEQQAAPSMTPKVFLSPLITGLGLSLLLRVDHPASMILAGSMAMLSKFVLRVQDKHIFNPGNFGIVAALLLTHNAWVSPGQWGEESWYALVFLGAGGLVLQRVGRWDTSVTFLLTYAALEAARNLWLGWTWDVWAHRLMNGSLLLFALFMITDPRTIPDARIARMIWAGIIALLTFLLRNLLFISTAPFWALFLLAPLTILLDKLFQSDRFLWEGRASSPTVEVLVKNPSNQSVSSSVSSSEVSVG